jgi:lipoprotein-releasing system permease protein
LKQNPSLFIALRYLWSRAHEGGRYLRGAAAGIAISLIPIIVTLIVSDGMIRGIIDRYLELGTGHLQVFEMYNTEKRDDLADRIMTVKGVSGAWQETRSMGVLAGKSGKTGVSVRSIDGSFWTDPGSARFLKVIDGEPAPKTDRDMLLGEALASNIGAKVGDTVRLMTIRSADGGRQMPVIAAFTVRGIVSCGYNELDALWCILNTEGGRRILSAGQSSSSMIIKVDDPYKKADQYSWDVYMELGGGYSILTWKELLRSQYSSYESTRQLLLFIMALIVIVAAINVSSATSMLVLERQRDIAVLKVSGANVKNITRIFLWGSFLTGIAGGIPGIIIGLLIGVNINSIIHSLEKALSFISGIFRGTEVKILDPGFYLETIPIVIDWAAVFLIAVFAVLCSVLASLIPAYRAGRLKPMELLRKT